MLDYTTLASESLLETQKIVGTLECQKLMAESNFIVESIMNGYIDTNVTFNQDILIEGAILDSITGFLDRLATMFRQRAVKKSLKYAEWVKDNQDVFIERVQKREPFKMRPYWKGKQGNDSSSIQTTIRDAARSYAEGKHDDYTWTHSFLDKEEILTDGSNSDLSDALKNYFRYNVKTIELPDKEEVSGTEVARLIPEMVDYVVKYKDNATKYVDAIANVVKTEMDKIEKNDAREDKKEEQTEKTKDAGGETKTEPKAEPVGDSLTVNTFLSVENRPICESMLTLSMNYSALLEEDNGASDVKKVQDDKKKDDDKENATEIETQDEKPKDGEDNSEEAEKEKDDKKEAEQKKKDYLNNIQKYEKYVVSAYSAALEERFVFYVNLFKTIGDANGGGPKFDKDGKYIKPKSKEEKEEGNKESLSMDNTDYNTIIKEDREFNSNNVIKFLLG